jgi:YggT family protein
VNRPQQGGRNWNAPVTVGGSIIQYWYFHVPNFVLAVVMYTLFGRVLLSLFVPSDSANYIWRFFCRLTDPFVALVAAVTPKAAAPVIIWLFGIVWLFWLRVLLLSVLIMLGVPPRAM